MGNKDLGRLPDVPALEAMATRHGLPCRLEAVDAGGSQYATTIHPGDNPRLQIASFRINAARSLMQPNKCRATATAP